MEELGKILTTFHSVKAYLPGHCSVLKSMPLNYPLFIYYNIRAAFSFLRKICCFRVSTRIVHDFYCARRLIANLYSWNFKTDALPGIVTPDELGLHIAPEGKGPLPY